jgi:cysteinyl-tRNA synthetase
MSKRYLGPTIDIHAGGQDLQFPHHENEIAQSEACNGVPFARYWMHNAYITIDKEKMSKSLGNFFTVREILEKYKGEVIRFFLLSGHYRSPIDFNDKLMDMAKNSLARFENAKSNLEHLIETGEGEMTEAEAAVFAKYDEYRNAFKAAMDDDLNTADAITAIFELVTEINTAVKDGASKEFAQKSLDTLLELTHVLGLLETEEDNAVGEEIQKLVDERQQARAEKNFARADEIRDILKEKGYVLKDTPQGVQIIKE